jgi:hypothetical protein
MVANVPDSTNRCRAQSGFIARIRGSDIRIGSHSEVLARKREVRFALKNRHRQHGLSGLKSAKLGNGSRRKIALHCEPKAHFLLDPDRLSSRFPKAYLG